MSASTGTATSGSRRLELLAYVIEQRGYLVICTDRIRPLGTIEDGFFFGFDNPIHQPVCITQETDLADLNQQRALMGFDRRSSEKKYFYRVITD